MVQRIVFLVQNGIGFGHIRRTLLIADEIKKQDTNVDIIFISQARSTLLLENSSFPCINFPFLHRLHDDPTENAFHILLNEVLKQLNPSLIIEDTYPDEWYRTVPTLRDIPKLILLRRIEPIDFDNYRQDGILKIYDRVLMIEEMIDFLEEKHTPESEFYVLMSGKFLFTGVVFHLPTFDEITRVQSKYAGLGEPLIVINTGAGGPQLNDAFSEKLFNSMGEVAKRFLEKNIKGHFLFVLGPYYPGQTPPNLKNITVVPFEPDLAALLHIADLVVIQPGFNVLYESLSSSASIVVTPGPSYMEGQKRRSEYLKEKYQISVGQYDDVNCLFEITERLLAERSSMSKRDPILPQQVRAAATILNLLHYYQNLNSYQDQLTGKPLFLLAGRIPSQFQSQVKQLFSQHNIHLVFKDYYEGEVVDLDTLRQTSEKPNYLILDSTKEIELTLAELYEKEVKVAFYTEETSFGMKAKEWCRHYSLQKVGILDHELCHFVLSENWKLQLAYRVSLMQFPTIFLDFSQVASIMEITRYIQELKDWIKITSCRLISIQDLISKIVIDKLEGKTNDSL